MKTLRTKLLAGIGVPAVILALLGVSWFSNLTHRTAEQEARDDVRERAELLAALFQVTDRTAPPGQPHRAVDAALADGPLWVGTHSVRVVDAQGLVRWSRDASELGTRVEVPFLEHTRILTKDGLVRVSEPLGGPGCTGCHGGRLGALELEEEEPRVLAAASVITRNALGSLVIFGLFLTLATALSVHFMLTRRLRRLAQWMNRAGQGELVVRADVEGEDEVGQLARAFNRMLEQMTSLKAEELEATRTLTVAQQELSLKQTLEATNVKLESRVNELSILYDVASSLTATLEFTELLARISKLVAERLQIARFSLMLMNTDGELEVIVALPANPVRTRMTFALGEGACGRAAQTRETVYIPDVSRDRETFVIKTGSRAEGSLLAVPIIAQGKLLGVLNLERPQVAAFEAAEIELMGAVAHQVAIGIQNARLHEETVALSITDALTQVPNRRHLFSRLELEVARAQRFGTPVSFIMVDIDHFKKLNDAVGHRAGDTTLREVADLLKGQVRKVDTLARYGGEEFALVLPQASKAVALEVGEKLRRAVWENDFDFGEVQPGGRVTLSVGVATLPEDGTTQEELVDAADSSLYASKRGGRNLTTGYSKGMELHPGRERGPHRKAPAGEPSDPPPSLKS